MEFTPLGDAAEPRLDRPLRAVFAAALFVPLVGVAVAYHDGLIDVDSVEEYEEAVSYRFKGTVTDPGGSDETKFFDLRDAETTRRFVWNATAVEPGRTYVVVAMYDAEAEILVAEALVRVYFFP